MSAGKLPEGWIESELSALGHIVTGKTPSTKQRSNFGGDIPFIKPGDLDLGGYIITTVDTLTDEGLTLVPELPANSIVVTCIGNLGKVGITFRRSASNQQINALIPSGKINVKFVYYQILTLKPWLESQSAATTIAIVNKSKFSQAPFKFPPISEQKIIAEKLDTLLAQVDSTKARLEQIPKILKRFRQAVLVTALSIANGKSRDFDRIVKLIDVAEKITDGEHITPKTVDAGIPLLSAKDVQENELLFDNVKYLSNATAEKALSRCSPGKDDILIVSRGATVGRTHLVSTNAKFCLMGSVLLIKLNKNLVLPRFMELVFKNISGQRQLVSASGATAQQAIYIRDVKEFSFNLLSLNEQHEIVRRVEQLFAYADAIEKQVNNALSHVNNLTQSILAKAFRGELTAQWRAENPALISGENSAAALLEKIKAERATSTGKKASRKKA